MSELSLASCINAAIGDTGEAQRLIKTLPRKGIRFVGRVQEEKSRGVEKKAEVVVPVDGPRTTLARAEIPSIAILPFTNMSGDPEQDYFADGMADEIVTALSRCPWLLVIARNSSFAYKGQTADVRHVGATSALAMCLRAMSDARASACGSRLNWPTRRLARTFGPIASKARWTTSSAFRIA